MCCMHIQTSLNLTLSTLDWIKITNRLKTNLLFKPRELSAGSEESSQPFIGLFRLSASFDGPINCQIHVKQGKTINAEPKQGHQVIQAWLKLSPSSGKQTFGWIPKCERLLGGSRGGICGVILGAFEVAPPCVLVAPLSCQVAN